MRGYGTTEGDKSSQATEFAEGLVRANLGGILHVLLSTLFPCGFLLYSLSSGSPLTCKLVFGVEELRTSTSGIASCSSRLWLAQVR